MKPNKLNAVVAVEKEVAARIKSKVTAIYHTFQKPDLFNGFSKIYQPIDEEGERYAPENKKVVCNTTDMLKSLSKLLTEFFDITLTKDVGNTFASSDIIVNGQTIASNVPITFLIFLEKQLVDIRTNINSIPILDINEDWTHDENSNLYKTENIKTHKTKKVPFRFVKYEPTVNHPAQVEILTRDDIVGHWNTVKMSGAISIPDKEKLFENIEKLIKAVKIAREQANSKEITQEQIGDSIFAYLLK